MDYRPILKLTASHGLFNPGDACLRAAKTIQCPQMCAWSEKSLRDDEFPDESDLTSSDDEAVTTSPCPVCGHEMYEESPRCPSCGNWVEFPASSSSDRPKWYMKAGFWATKTLLLNWIFWICVSAMAAAAAWSRWMSE